MKETDIFPRASHARIPRLSVTLPRELIKTFMNNVVVHDPASLTGRLKIRLGNLEKDFVAAYPELKKLKATIDEMTIQERLTPISPEKLNEVSMRYTERLLQRFVEMIEWCRENDKWALQSINHISNPQSTSKYLAYVSAPRGGVPLTHTREDRAEKFRELAKKQAQKRKESLMKCLGFGEFKGKCQNIAGHPAKEMLPENPYWCARCDWLRVQHITKQFNDLYEKFNETK